MSWRNKLLWNLFPEVENFGVGDIIKDDANDKYRILAIDYINRKVKLEEVFASGNFDGPFWVTEEEIVVHGMYPANTPNIDPPY